MLKFDSLELLGFKSFAEKTRLVFHDRISAIIGPNGCGKSNIADAIGWVLGVHTAKNLRGQKMEDVIFNGTGKRKPSGFAEVTLTLRRTDQTPIVLEGEELPDPVLEISRKLYRDGESQYWINQRRCRLRDIHQFLEEAGLGFASYAMIAQGKIDSFLTSKPLDRRIVIEEAAQITGYKSRRRSAELKLEMAQQNLLRVNDIIAEVERQLRSLKRQAAKARRYRRLKESFRELQRIRFAAEAGRLGRVLEELQGQLAALREEEAELARELESQEKIQRQAARKREEREQELALLRQRRSEVMMELDRSRHSISYHQEQIQALQGALKSEASEEEATGQSLQRTEEELGRFEEERIQLEEQEEQTRRSLQEHQQTADRYGAELREREARLEELRSALLQLSAETASLKNTREQLGERIRTGETARQRLGQELEQHRVQLQQAENLLAEKEGLIASKEEELRGRRQELSQQEEQRARLQSQVDEMREEVAACQNRLIALRERLQSLQEVELNHSHYSESVQKVLRHLSQSQAVRTGGTLADFIETSPQFERVVEEVLDEELEYVLVDSLEEAVRGVVELKNVKGGKCTFLSLHSNGFRTGNGNSPVPPQPQEGVFGKLLDLVQMEPRIGEAFQRVLPQRAQAVVVDDLDRAFRLAHDYPEHTFITLEGEELTPRGLLAGSAGQSKKLGLLSLKRQKRELEEKVVRQRQALSLVEEKRTALAAELDLLSSLCARGREDLYSREKELIGLRHERDQAERDLQRQRQALQVVQEELSRLEGERSGWIRQQELAARELAEKERRQEESQRLLSETHRFLEQLRSDHARVQEQVNAVASDQKVLEERRAALERTLERIREQREGLEARRDYLRTRQAQNRRRLQELADQLEQLEESLVRFQQESERLTLQVSELEEQWEAAKEEMRQLDSRLEQLRARRSEWQERRAGLDLERVRVETQFLSLQEQCREQLRESLEEAAAGVSLEEVDLEDVNRRHDELKRRLERFGPINMTALQEYQQNQERYEFLTRQREDIETSIADTTRAIQDLNRRSRQQFQEAFDAINLHFKEVFQKLFGGGDCGMQLLDEDVLECGIDLYAQPPGKKLQNVMLLSGGEKAMTVFALLVALFRYRPSQFCVLDEVDAALDDANVARFGSLIREMSQHTQLVLITHNKRSMELADSLFGVTMEEPGISKVVSAQI